MQEPRVRQGVGSELVLRDTKPREGGSPGTGRRMCESRARAGPVAAGCPRVRNGVLRTWGLRGLQVLMSELDGVL